VGSEHLHIDPRNIFSHVLHYINLLCIVKKPHFLTYVRKISIHMVSPTTPTLNRFLPLSLPHYLFHSGLSRSLLSLRIISEELWLSPFLPLFHLVYILVFPSFLEIWYSFLLIIKGFISPYGFLQCFGIIILYLVTDK
jgi:hypothetical protein